MSLETIGVNLPERETFYHNPMRGTSGAGLFHCYDFFVRAWGRKLNNAADLAWHDSCCCSATERARDFRGTCKRVTGVLSAPGEKGTLAMVALRKIQWGTHSEATKLLLFIAILPVLAMSGCEMIGDIFQAGVWVGALLVVGVIALIIWMVSRSRA